MMENLLYVTENQVKRHLKWKTLIPAIEKSFSLASSKNNTVIQPPRLFMNIPSKEGVLLAMPGYCDDGPLFGCKMVTAFPKNNEKNLASIFASMLLFDGDTGKLFAIMEATELTGWRTAAASVVATKFIHRGKKKILTVLGAGKQAETHVTALQHEFNFQEIRIWNRTKENAERLRDNLNLKNVKILSNNNDAVRDADVICTTTYATEPIVNYKSLKRGVHINAVGAGTIHYSELDNETYRNSIIVTDNLESAKIELKGLFDDQMDIWGEVGEIVNGRQFNHDKDVTIFHSLGMAIEDIVSANLIYNSIKEDNKQSK